MRLPELIAATCDERVTPRFVRFLVAEKVIPAPAGGRAHANYGPFHLAGIQRYLRLRDLGLSVLAIKLLDQGESLEAVAVSLAPGITLSVRTADLTLIPDARTLARRITLALADITRAAVPADDITDVAAERIEHT